MCMVGRLGGVQGASRLGLHRGCLQFCFLIFEICFRVI